MIDILEVAVPYKKSEFIEKTPSSENVDIYHDAYVNNNKLEINHYIKKGIGGHRTMETSFLLNGEAEKKKQIPFKDYRSVYDTVKSSTYDAINTHKPHKITFEASEHRYKNSYKKLAARIAKDFNGEYASSLLHKGKYSVYLNHEE